MKTPCGPNGSVTGTDSSTASCCCGVTFTATGEGDVEGRATALLDAHLRDNGVVIPPPSAAAIERVAAVLRNADRRIAAQAAKGRRPS